MKSLLTISTPPKPCAYRSGETSSMRYDFVAEIDAVEYQTKMHQGWRKFGHGLFRPDCPACKACTPLRVVTKEFLPSRSLRRVQNLNRGAVELKIGAPELTEEKLELHRKFHSSQAERIGWPDREPETPEAYFESFVDQPFASEEWLYYFEGRLVGVGYVDPVPLGLSMVYFFHDPEFHDRSLGTWNVLCGIATAAARGLPYVYLGYFVEGCRSLEYKGRYTPSESLNWESLEWEEFGKS